MMLAAKSIIFSGAGVAAFRRGSEEQPRSNFAGLLLVSVNGYFRGPKVPLKGERISLQK